MCKLNLKTMFISPNSEISKLSHPSNQVFRFIEQRFDEWLEGSNPANEYEEKYFGHDAIYSKKYAIEQVIEAAIEEANDENKKVDLRTFDYDAIFGD